MFEAATWNSRRMTHDVKTNLQNRLLLGVDPWSSGAVTYIYIRLACRWLNHLKHEDNLCNFKTCVPTSQKTDCVSIRKKNQLLLCREMVAVYCENVTKYVNAHQENAKLLNINANGTCSYFCCLKVATPENKIK